MHPDSRPLVDDSAPLALLEFETRQHSCASSCRIARLHLGLYHCPNSIPPIHGCSTRQSRLPRWSARACSFAHNPSRHPTDHICRRSSHLVLLLSPPTTSQFTAGSAPQKAGHPAFPAAIQGLFLPYLTLPCMRIIPLC